MTSTNQSPSAAAARQWDHLRTAFASSLMVDLPLASLAQNLDGLAWPLAGASETPAAYIDLTYDELRLQFAARGQPDAANLLLQILRETLAFDQPFGEMVQQTAASANRENPLLRTLARLGIPEDFPIDLTALDATSLELCQLEEVRTLGEFALFAQRLAANVIVGGDLRRLLNALALVDGGALAELLPFRVGRPGLHLAEALVQATRRPQPAVQVARAVTWFADEFALWQQSAQDRKFLSRQFAHFDDPELDKQISRLLQPYLGGLSGRPALWASLRRWFKP